MIFDQGIIEALEKFPEAPWAGHVFRHMFGNFPPERENVSGARWNPPQIPAIYTSLKRDVALAEADYYIASQPLRPRATRKLYTVNVVLNSVIDLSDWRKLADFGLQKEFFAAVDYTPCQLVGGAVEWLGHDGLLVPSARAVGVNLVIFPNKQKSNYRFEVIDCDELEE